MEEGLVRVQTAEGEFRIPRSEIASVEFSANHEAAAARGEPDYPQSGRETSAALSFTHPEGKFSLRLPAGWQESAELKRQSAEVAAVFSSADGAAVVTVMAEEFSGTLESYCGLVEIQMKARFSGYEKLSEGAIEIGGRPAMRLVWKGRPRPEEASVLKVQVVLVRSDHRIWRISGFALERHFDVHARAMEEIANAFRLPESSPKT
jgi:hypothetical protein